MLRVAAAANSRCRVLRHCSTFSSPARTTTPIHKLLVANRGEISCRVQATARKMGIPTVAVYSEADRHAMHVQMADEACCIGPAASVDSYLRADRVLAACQETGANAVHPGYGFLSENTEFAEQCAANDVIFVGPPASAIRDMGIKSTSKYIMSAAGVPIIEGYHGEDQSDSNLLEEAEKIGFPVMLKAVRGGGGKGMRIAVSREEFAEQLESARTEARKSFGDDVMLVEKFVVRPRHVEVQVFGDQYGDCVYLWERDCSVQRRHQKVLEEAPAPGLTDQTRRSIGDAAVRAAKAVGYVGAGTVEFIMDDQQNFYFMEMNTRLQVEHPVTEMITGLDLVSLQLRVAAGEPLPMTQDDVKRHGHAFEVRLYAEDPQQGFLPGAGTLNHLQLPSSSEGVRVDTGVRSGDEVSIHYDPMIAKLVAWGEDRGAALQRLRRALADTRIAGPATNVAFLAQLAQHPEVAAGNVHTGFIEEHEKALLSPVPPSAETVGVAALALTAFQASAALCGSTRDTASPWGSCASLRVNHPLASTVTLGYGGDTLSPVLTYVGQGRYQVTLGERALDLTVALSTSDTSELCLDVTRNDVTRRYVAVRDGSDVIVYGGTSGQSFRFEAASPAFVREAGEGAASGGAVAPMPGVIDRVLVAPGQAVQQGDAVVVMVAMKMEYVIRAPHDGVVKDVPHAAGDTVAKGTALLTLETTE